MTKRFSDMSDEEKIEFSKDMTIEEIGDIVTEEIIDEIFADRDRVKKLYAENFKFMSLYFALFNEVNWFRWDLKGDKVYDDYTQSDTLDKKHVLEKLTKMLDIDDEHLEFIDRNFDSLRFK